MASIEELIQQLEQSGKDVFWQGPASEASIYELEELIGTRLPASLKNFLASHGGGGVVGEEVSGIENDNPILEYRGTIYGDTLLCRESYGLPANLIVIYLGGDDVVWCLDIDSFDGDDCSVVSFNVSNKVVAKLASGFSEFLEEYLSIRIAR